MKCYDTALQIQKQDTGYKIRIQSACKNQM